MFKVVSVITGNVLYRGTLPQCRSILVGIARQVQPPFGATVHAGPATFNSAYFAKWGHMGWVGKGSPSGWSAFYITK